MTRLVVPRAKTAPTPIIAVDLASRGERKLRTRAHLMEGALDLMGQGRGFSGLSLREVTRAAGVVPASFYRHFRDLDELGLALVEESGATLRRLLRDVRRDGIPLTDMLRKSVQIYKQHVEAHRLHFLFIAGERGGGAPVIRKAIRTEESHFASEMAQDMRALGLLPGLSSETLRMLCGLVVTTMINAATEILDLPRQQPRLEKELVDNFVRQLRLVFLGASAWRDR
ncbi:MAG: TetR family transcriptional regulator [Pseudomonadota bacterium]|nr:TetR family transcriptional regulator [Pseudomonadota bacterium]